MISYQRPPWGWEQTKLPELCLQARWHLSHINDSFSCYTYTVFIWVEALFYRRCLFSFLHFHICFFRVQRFGYVLLFFFFKHNHSRKFGSCPSGEQMRRRLPAVLFRLSLPFYCTALILDGIGIFLLLLGEGYSDIFFRVTAHRLSDSAKERDRKRVEITCSIFQLRTKWFPWHQSIKG